MKKVLLIAMFTNPLARVCLLRTLIKENSPRYKDLGDWKETSTKTKH